MQRLGASPATQHNKKRFGDDSEISSEGPVLDVVKVQLNSFLVGTVAPPAGLPGPGQSWPDRKIFSSVFPIPAKFIPNYWPRSHQTHLAAYYVNQLG